MQACTKYWVCLLGTKGAFLYITMLEQGSAQWLVASFLLVFDKREVITGQQSVQATVLRHPPVLLQIGSHYPGQISIIQFSYFHRGVHTS